VPAPPADPAERALRERLGIPDDAARVLVLTETSHWDPNWLLTSEGYYRLRVRRGLLQALDELAADPRRVYSVECVFFLRMFYERVPERRRQIRELVNSGRLRLMGSGVTTPDTIVPPTELLIRDYLLGQEWLRASGMTAEPEVAYFPDTFGFSPGLPEVLRAVGVARAALCRIDGMYFFGNETELPGRFPRPGSSAELLLTGHRSLDFVWRGPDGAELLCHWLAFTYGQGDMLAHLGLTRQAGVPLAVPWRTDRHIARMIDRFVGQLAPVAKTPYLLCPIGFDFTAPIRRLVELLDRYNERRYDETGTWVVNAGLDDYLALVDHHRADLPRLDLDPSQYFSGFFTSRPTLKRRYTQLADTLLLAERLALQPGGRVESTETAHSQLAESWWTAVTANHHDYVTGTSPDRVVRREQLPWLDDALRAAEGVLGNVAGEEGGVAPVTVADEVRPDASPAPVPGRGEPVGTREGPLVTVEAGSLRVVFDEHRGGAVVSVTADDGTALLGPAPSFDVVAYADSGGLWRMGHEYAGGQFAMVDRLSLRPAAVHARRLDDGTVEVETVGTLDGQPVRRRIRVDGAASRLRCRVVTTLGDRRTATVTAVLPHPADHLVTDTPGGVVRRPAGRWFRPTFWAVQSFAHLEDEAAGRGTALLLGMPGAVALRTEGGGDGRGGGPGGRHLELVAARNATQETAYRVVPLPAQPARGHDPGPHRFDVAVAFTGGGDWRAAGLRSLAADEARRARLTAHGSALAARADAVVTTDRDDVAVLAAKPAHRGPGAVVRLCSTSDGPCEVRLRRPGAVVTAAAICDGRERDVAPLVVDGGDGVTLRVPPGITSVRLVS
jgi:hypothetical protein